MNQIEKALIKAQEIKPGRTGAFRPNAKYSANDTESDYTSNLVAPADRKKMAAERLVADSLEHPISDVYRLLRTQVLQRMKKLNISTLAVTGPTVGTGVTTTAANLAISMALDVNQTVLLVDLNLRSPDIHKKFGFQPRAGINDYMHGDANLSDCLINPGLSRLAVLPARTAEAEAAEIISSPRMASLAEQLRRQYTDRIIIYDMPPLLASGDTLGFLPYVDAVLLVTRSGKTTKTELDRAAHLLDNNVIIGTLLNAQ